jgi:hypothetical protein
MGHYTDDRGCQHFEPDNTENEFFVQMTTEVPMEDLIEKATSYFNLPIDGINISCEYIHTRYLGYDRYDPGDYTLYLVFSRRW